MTAVTVLPHEVTQLLLDWTRYSRTSRAERGCGGLTGPGGCRLVPND